MNYPVYSVDKINPLDAGVSKGVFEIAIVAEPAMETAGLYLDSQKKETSFIKLSSEGGKTRLAGAVLIPDKLIFRKNYFPTPENPSGDCFLKFSSEVIKQCLTGFIKNNMDKPANLGHGQTKISGMYLENWLVNPGTDLGIKSEGKPLPDGTWVSVFHVDNPDLFTEEFAASFTGFSIEGFFDYELKLSKSNNLEFNMFDNLRMMFGALLKANKQVNNLKLSWVEIPNLGIVDIDNQGKILLVDPQTMSPTIAPSDGVYPFNDMNDLNIKNGVAVFTVKGATAQPNDTVDEGLAAANAATGAAMETVNTLSTELQKVKLELAKRETELVTAKSNLVATETKLNAVELNLSAANAKLEEPIINRLQFSKDELGVDDNFEKTITNFLK